MITIEELGLDRLHVVTTNQPLTGEGFEKIRAVVHEFCQRANGYNSYKVYDAKDALDTWWDWTWTAAQEDPERTTTTVRDGRTVEVPLVYRGNFPTRISAMLHHVAGIRLDNQLKERIGNLYSMYRAGAQDVIFRVTKDVDWDEGTFGDSGSCYWSYNSAARWFIQGEGWALQRFTKKWEQYYEFREAAHSRAWILPWSNYRFHGYVVFNGYSNYVDEDGYGRTLPAMAGALANLLGGVTQRVRLSNEGYTDGTLFINGGAGIVIAPDWDAVKSLGNEINFHHHVARSYEECVRCGDEIDLDDGNYYYYDDDYLCVRCYDRYFFTCCNCGEVLPDDDGHTNGNGETFCRGCAGQQDDYCSYCGNFADDPDAMVESLNFGMVCESCAELMEECGKCGRVGNTRSMDYTAEGEVLCRDCWKEEQCLRSMV